MLRRSIAAFLGLALLCGTLAAVATAADKDKDSAKKDAKDKDAKKEGKEFEGKITKVDVDKGTLSIKGDDGKTLDFKFDDDTKFIGPKGGASESGIKDDRLVKGAEVTLVVAGNNRTIREIRLPERKGKTR